MLFMLIDINMQMKQKIIQVLYIYKCGETQRETKNVDVHCNFRIIQLKNETQF